MEEEVVVQTNNSVLGSDVVVFVIFIILLIVFVVITYKILRRTLKTKTEIITAFTGGLGSGKTNLSVDKAKMLINRNRRKLKRVIKWRKIRNRILFWKTPKNVVFDRPILLSNIPVVVYRPSKIRVWLCKLFRFKIPEIEYSTKLTKDMLLLQTSIPQGSVVLLDEIGAWSSQFQFNDDNVVKVFDEFVRLFRHYYAVEGTNIEPYMVVNDQCSENINFVIRRRLNMVHNLSNFLRIWRFAFYYERIISVSEEIKTIDTRTGIENDTQDNSNFRFKFFFWTKAYDSHCYRGRAKRLPRNDFVPFEELTTNDLLRCPTDKEQRYYALTQTKEEINALKKSNDKRKRNQSTSNRW